MVIGCLGLYFDLAMPPLGEGEETRYRTVYLPGLKFLTVARFLVVTSLILFWVVLFRTSVE